MAVVDHGAPKKSSLARKALGGAGVLLLGLGLWAWHLVAAQEPDEEVPRLPGLSAAVTVRFDARGVPTVQAANLLDATRVQGYLVARERLFQMELARRLADGRLADLFGPEALGRDQAMRPYGFRQVAETAAASLPADQRALLDAYVAGVNAFRDSHRERWGLEFKLLQHEPAPWSPADSLKVLLLMSNDLSDTWQDELEAEQLARLPVPLQRLLMPRVTEADVLVVPDNLPAPSSDVTTAFAASVDAGSPEPGDKSGRLELAPPHRRPRGMRGSNNWVVAGSRTASGKPMLANDPHLSIVAPGVWYQVRLELPDFWVQGVTLAGLPGVVIGNTARVAWGFTNLGTDVQDLFREPPQSERVETIAVAGAPSVELKVPVGKHGPQLRPGYSLQWTALDPKNLQLPFTNLAQVRDWQTFNQLLDGFTGPAQNVVYADVDGHIGWRATGLIPLRREGDDGSLPRDGTDPANDWRGYLPMSELPRVLDPAQGYVVTANQRVIGSSFATPVATDWESPNRARRIVALLEHAPKLDRDAMERIQLDVVSPFHRELMRALSSQVPGLERFKTFDGSAGAESADYVVAYAWERAVEQTVVERLGGPANFSWFNRDGSSLALVYADAAAWQRAGLGDKASFLQQAKKSADDYLAQHRGEAWGTVNLRRIMHPFGEAGGVVAAIFNPPSFPQSGSSYTVRAAWEDSGQSMRQVVDLAAPEEATLVVPLGESGHQLSPHLSDQLATWRNGDPGGKQTRLKQPPVGRALTFAP